MGLYNFQERFVPFIASGAKTHTIRAPRRHPDVAGSFLYLYTGLRRKGAKLLLIATCTRVQQITITAFTNVMIDGQRLDDDECEALARSDGFVSFDDMMQFWEGRLPFHGQVIHWEAFTGKPKRKNARRGRRAF